MTFHRASGLKAQFPAFRCRTIHYLDSAATAQMPQPVIDAVRDYDVNYRANVHGEVHQLASRAIAAYEDARVEPSTDCAHVCRVPNASIKSPSHVVRALRPSSAPKATVHRGPVAPVGSSHGARLLRTQVPNR